MSLLRLASVSKLEISLLFKKRCVSAYLAPAEKMKKKQRQKVACTLNFLFLCVCYMEMR